MKCNRLLFLPLMLVFATSCRTPKDIVYFQDAGNYTAYKDVDKFEVYIHKDDLLAIMVNSQASEAALPFNLPMANYYVGGSSYGGQRMLGYLVDSEGDIDFPVIGKLHVEGLNRNQLRDLISSKLIEGGYLKDPIVTIHFMNFKVSVQGEVSRPGSFNISGERVTLLEALSMAGDLTIYGRRDRVAVIREKEGRRTILYHDLTSTDLFNSPCYYLQQNDIVYVEPNKRRVQQSDINQNNSVGVWMSIASFFMSTVTFVFTMRNRIKNT